MVLNDEAYRKQIREWAKQAQLNLDDDTTFSGSVPDYIESFSEDSSTLSAADPSWTIVQETPWHPVVASMKNRHLSDQWQLGTELQALERRIAARAMILASKPSLSAHTRLESTSDSSTLSESSSDSSTLSSDWTQLDATPWSPIKSRINNALIARIWDTHTRLEPASGSSTLSESSSDSSTLSSDWTQLDAVPWSPIKSRINNALIARIWENARDTGASTLSASPPATPPGSDVACRQASASTRTRLESSELHSFAPEIQHTHSGPSSEAVESIPAPSDHAVHTHESSILSGASAPSSPSPPSVAGSYNSCPDAFIHSDYLQTPDYVAASVRQHMRRISMRQDLGSTPASTSQTPQVPGRPRVASWLPACVAGATITALAGLAYTAYTWFS